jgi:hypothetical protein
MGLLFWLALSKTFKRHVVYLTPEQITEIIQEWHPDTKYTGKKIKIRKSMWYTRDLRVLSGPMPTVVDSTWAMSEPIWVIFIVSFIFPPLGIMFAIAHYLTNVQFSDKIVESIQYYSAYPPQKKRGVHRPVTVTETKPNRY